MSRYVDIFGILKKRLKLCHPSRAVAVAIMSLLLFQGDIAAQILRDTPANRARGVVGCTQTSSGISCPRKQSPTQQKPRGPTEQELQQAREMGVHELNDLGVEYYNNGDLASAINYFRAALEISPDFPTVWDNLQGALKKQAEARAEATRRAEAAEAKRRAQAAEAKRRPEAKRRAQAAEAKRRAEAIVIASAQSKVDQADPNWVKEVQDRSRTAIQLRRSEIEAKTRSFKMREPPPPQLPLPLSKIKTGDIILVGPSNSVLGAAQGFVQGFAEEKWFGNPKAPVTHALVYIGEKSGVKMYMDNQPGTGPQIISEALFKSRYGGRPLYAARPTLEPDGREMYKAAWDYALANAEARKRGLPGTNYGVFGNGNVVCSETALFAVVRAQTPGKRFVVENIVGKRLLSPVKVTPGDIYDQDGKGYFTVRPMNING